MAEIHVEPAARCDVHTLANRLGAQPAIYGSVAQRGRPQATDSGGLGQGNAGVPVGCMGGGRLLVGGNSSQVSIKRHRPVDRGSFMTRSQTAGVPAGARQGVVTPHTARFTIQKVDRLHVTRMEKCYKEMAYDADILDIEDEPEEIAQ